MKIWFINHYAGNEELGMEYRHFFLSRYLKENGHDPLIINASFHHLYRKPPQVTQKVTFRTYDDIPFCIIKTPAYSSNGAARLINMVTFARRLNKHFSTIIHTHSTPDIVIGSSPHIFIVNNLLFIKKKYKIPVFFEVRDPWPHVLKSLGLMSRFNPLYHYFAYLEKKAFKYCDRIISLWHSNYIYMGRLGLPEEKYQFIPNGIEIKDTNPEPDFSHPLIKQLRELKEKGFFIVGYAGSHGKFNPLRCALNTCKLLMERNNPRIVFFFVGNGPEKSKLVSDARKYGLTNIYFHDPVPRNVILMYYQLIDAAYMGLVENPIFRYGPTPNKLMDYFLAAKPIVYAINSDFDPVKESNSGISIPPDNPEKLAHALDHMSTMDKRELIKWGKNGRKYAEETFNFKILASTLSNVCRNVLINKPTR